MIVADVRANSAKAEGTKRPYYTTEVHPSMAAADLHAAQWRKEGRSARVYRRAIKADNLILTLWVVVVRGAAS
jgi:hypothetical protein